MNELWLPEGLPRAQQVDAEQACQTALRGWERRTEVRLSREDREDALQELRWAAVAASRRFDTTRNVSFQNYLVAVLKYRATDWIRADEGRTVWKFSGHTYTREKRTVLSLDAPNGDGDAGTLGDILAAPDRSAQEAWNEALGWLHATRDSCAAADRRIIDDALFEVDAAEAA